VFASACAPNAAEHNSKLAEFLDQRLRYAPPTLVCCYYSYFPSSNSSRNVSILPVRFAPRFSHGFPLFLLQILYRVFYCVLLSTRSLTAAAISEMHSARPFVVVFAE